MSGITSFRMGVQATSAPPPTGTARQYIVPSTIPGMSFYLNESTTPTLEYIAANVYINENAS